jgi:hypothetical protein
VPVLHDGWQDVLLNSRPRVRHHIVQDPGGAYVLVAIEADHLLTGGIDKQDLAFR